MSAPERLYKVHVVGSWFETGSRSDGMCGWVQFENVVTTEYVGYHWSVDDPTCRSQEAARAMARGDFAAGVEVAG